jgi:hypothetical protein
MFIFRKLKRGLRLFYEKGAEIMYLSEYQTFQSKHEMNEAISDHLAEHRFDLTETNRNVLTIVTQYAVKFPGVAHLKAATISDLVNGRSKSVNFETLTAIIDALNRISFESGKVKRYGIEDVFTHGIE